MNSSGDEPKISRQLLLDRLIALSDLQESAAESRRPIELDQTSVGRLSRVDAMQHQAMALEIERRRGNEKLRIEAALRRMDTGDFGYCISCGDEIASQRLAVDPTIPTCIRCASEASR